MYLVGGAVRDLLMGGQPADLDLVVDGDAGALAASLGGNVRRYDRFGTCTVALEGFNYDIARARRERYPRPGALPEVEPASLHEDLLRRDFTVNAAAVELAGPQAGQLSTAPSALEDLDRRLLRVLHDRSFADDPTRLLRLVRYASRLGFELEPCTRELVNEAIRRHSLRTVSGPRVGAELRLLAREPDPLCALRALEELGIGAEVDPGFGLHDVGLARRALALVPRDARRDRLVLALAARDMQERRLALLLEALAFEAADRDVILAAGSRADQVATSLARASAPSEIARAVAGGPPELVALAGALGPAEQARQWLTGGLRHVRLEIDGAALLAAGVPEGPAVGRGLRAALAAKLDGRAPVRDQELAEALRAARSVGR